MRICIVSPEYPPKVGGIGNYVRALARVLEDRGHHVVLIAPFADRRTLKDLRPSNVRAIGLGLLGLMPFYVRSLKTLSGLRSHFDVIHVNGLLSPLPSTIQGKSVVSVHTTYTGKLVALSYMSEKADLFLCSSADKVRARFESLYCRFASSFEKAALESSWVTLAVNRSVAQELRTYGLDAQVVPIAIDTKVFRPPGISPSPSAEKTVLSVGRLIQRKGFALLLRAARRVLSLERGIEFHIVGMGSEYASLIRLSNKLGLGSHVKFLGRASFRTLLDEYQSCSLYVQASVYEGLPTTMLEAMACGKPVVAIRVPYAASVVENGVNGALSQASVEDLSDKILAIIADGELRNKMKRNNVSLINERYSWGKIVPLIEREYAKVCP